jgi:hypothetical protein
MSTTSLPRPPASQAELTVSVEQSLNALEAHPFANLRFVTVTFPAAFAIVRVSHGLGYPMSGWFVVATTSLAQVFQTSAPDASDPANFANFGSSVAATVKLAVF